MKLRQMKYAFVVAIMAFLVSGCLGAGGGGSTSSDDTNEIRQLMQAYVRHAANYEWNELVKLYNYPLMLVVAQESPYDAEEFGDKEKLEEEAESSLELIREEIEKVAPGAVEISLEYDIRGNPPHSIYIELHFEIDNESAAAKILPEVVFYDLYDYEEHIYDVILDQISIPASGSKRQVTAQLTLVPLDEDHEELFETAKESFTVERVSSTWKITQHKHQWDTISIEAE